MTTANDVLQAALSSDVETAKQKMDELIGSKVVDKIEALKQQIASNLFAPTEQEEE